MKYFKDFVKKNIINLLNSKNGQRIVNLYLLNNLSFAVHFLQKNNKFTIKDIDLDKLSHDHNFENLTWLFYCNEANRGIARLNFDEASYLFSLAKSIPEANIIEIGRCHGGSTILFASASDTNSKILSIDKRPKDDESLKKVLQKLNINSKVNLVVEDANKLTPKNSVYDILFIDGDHSYKGASMDYSHWKNSLKVGGHLLFHDYTKTAPDVVKLVNEIKKNDSSFKEIKQTGSVIDFIKVK